MSKLERLYDLLYNDKTGFLMTLRFNKELMINYQQVLEIKSCIKELTLQWKDQDVIPKDACMIFIDFYSSMESVAARYNDADSDTILIIANEIMEEIRNCCN